MMGPKVMDGEENGTIVDLENGTISSHEDGTKNSKPVTEPPKKMMSRLRSGVLIGSSRNNKSPSSGDKLEILVTKYGEEPAKLKDKEKQRKKLGKPPKPPRPPRHPASSAPRLETKKTSREGSEHAMPKQTKLERMRSWKRTRTDRVLVLPSSSSPSSSAPSSPSPRVLPAKISTKMVGIAISIVFCYVVIFQGVLGSRL